MSRLPKSFPLAAALLLALPSCVVAFGNKNVSPHPHKECKICSEQLDNQQASVDHEHVAPELLPAVLADDEPALAARQ